MTRAIILFLSLLTVSCGSVSVTKNADGSYEASSMSFLKDIKDVSIYKDAEGNVDASMGSSTTNQNAESALMLVCTLSPAAPMCQVDK